MMDADRNHKRRGRGRLGDAALALALIVGTGLLLYPTVSDLWNRNKSSRAVSSYSEAMEGMGGREKQGLRDAAVSYNRGLIPQYGRFTLEPEGGEGYADLLDVDGNGMMGYIEIPSIDVELPIYHGVSARVLQSAAGHIPGSSLPVGGEGTHCVISAHRGLPSAKLFTDLDELKEGDGFSLHVLGEELFYEVDRIRTVLPEEVGGLDIEEGKDYCTLVTCTPYGINTHRLLVRGHRVGEDVAVEPGADASIMRAWKEALFLGVPVILALFIWAMARPKKERGGADEDLEIM